jgi:hypothetical protein
MIPQNTGSHCFVQKSSASDRSLSAECGHPSRSGLSVLANELPPSTLLPRNCARVKRNLTNFSNACEKAFSKPQAFWGHPDKSREKSRTENRVHDVTEARQAPTSACPGLADGGMEFLLRRVMPIIRPAPPRRGNLRSSLSISAIDDREPFTNRRVRIAGWPVQCLTFKPQGRRRLKQTPRRQAAPPRVRASRQPRVSAVRRPGP